MCQQSLHNQNIDVPWSKPVLPSAAQARNSTGLKICTHIVLTLTGDQTVFSQPSQGCNLLYQGGEIHGFHASMSKDLLKRASYIDFGAIQMACKIMFLLEYLHCYGKSICLPIISPLRKDSDEIYFPYFSYKFSIYIKQSFKREETP